MVRVRALDDDVKLAADLRLAICSSRISHAFAVGFSSSSVHGELVKLTRVHVVRILSLTELTRCG